MTPILAWIPFLFPAGVYATGFLTVNGKTVELTHVYAYTAPQSLDSSRPATFLLAADRELGPEVRTNPDAVRGLVWEGKLHAVEVEFDDGGGASWILKTTLAGMPISGSRSPHPFDVRIAGGRAKGTVKLPQPATLGDHTFDFGFQVDASIEKQPAEREPTAEDRRRAAASEAAQAYLEYQRVLAAGDMEGLLRMLEPEKAAEARSNPDFPKVLQFIRSLQPKDIAVLKATHYGNTATLLAEGREDGEPTRGRVAMQKTGGQWRIVSESWKPKPR